MKLDALISADGKYRYWLSRIWYDTLKTVTFVGLNPSTADATKDDPTIVACTHYAKSWGFGGLFMVNLFAYRDTNQKQIWNEPDPVGPENDAWLYKMAGRSSLIIAAWGNHGKHSGRSAAACELLPPLRSLKVNKSGEPHHPLYLPADIKPKPYHRSPYNRD